MPPLGYERYEANRQPSEAEKLVEMSITKRMRDLMARNTTKQTENVNQTPKAEYPSSEGLVVRAWLQKTFPTRNAADGGEIMLLTQRVQDSGESDIPDQSSADVRLTIHSKLDGPVEYTGIDKLNMTEEECLRLAQNVMETLDLIERAVNAQPSFELSQF